ncbi:hypothetical protein CEXT_47791 [Caerostris extrusa]|uniref:Uncharacterized protein n=1 Tax=Caerostris extrusa TaxID=172846 RepID=A0AAV4Q141_CAEEX|nr:hypothetical protein CEXT_47791 [Caerostris extrusa]
MNVKSILLFANPEMESVWRVFGENVCDGSWQSRVVASWQHTMAFPLGATLPHGFLRIRSRFKIKYNLLSSLRSNIISIVKNAYSSLRSIYNQALKQTALQKQQNSIADEAQEPA